MRPVDRLAAARRLARCEKGATLVEYAFVLPVLLSLVLGLMQLGGMAWAQAGLDFAVQQAARCAAVRPDICGKPPDIARYAASQLPGVKTAPDTFDVKSAPCGTQVSARLKYDLFASTYGMPAATLTAEVCQP